MCATEECCAEEARRASQIVAGQEGVPEVEDEEEASKDRKEEADEALGMDVEPEGFGMEESEAKFEHTQAMEVSLQFGRSKAAILD